MCNDSRRWSLVSPNGGDDSRDTSDELRTMNCSTCKQPIQWEGNPFRPFCSERCRLLDLNGWLSEQYRVPAEDVGMDVHESSSEEGSVESNGKH